MLTSCLKISYSRLFLLLLFLPFPLLLRRTYAPRFLPYYLFITLLSLYPPLAPSLTTPHPLSFLREIGRGGESKRNRNSSDIGPASLATAPYAPLAAETRVLGLRSAGPTLSARTTSPIFPFVFSLNFSRLTLRSVHSCLIRELWLYLRHPDRGKMSKKRHLLGLNICLTVFDVKV